MTFLMSEERITHLETKIAYQDVILEDLNQVVIQQQKSIDKLEDAMSTLVKKFKEATLGNLEIGPANDKPPHY